MLIQATKTASNPLAATTESKTVDTYHEDVVHDAVLDFYGSKLATCSSDRTVKVFDVQNGTAVSAGETLVGHEGPVWQVAWAHPSFGTILASASYDGKVFIWKNESAGAQSYGSSWTRIKDHALHTASVNSIAWAPHELGATLACASSDGKVSVLTFNSDGSWSVDLVTAHPTGSNSVTWAPTVVSSADVNEPVPLVRRFATAGCDAVVKIWEFSDEHSRYVEVDQLIGHSDWVRDVAFAPNLGLARTYLASASQDRTVIIWTQDSPDTPWTKTFLQPRSDKDDPTKFSDTVWRVSWSVSGNVLAVSCGDGKVSLWKENLKGAWECINDLDA
ncbi:GTPase-activating protein S13 [Malassezia psittaci]|uniref:GTPase-activating protein S13 n=1 Tax=Malassezia psittaci TaxID=1821823 RepID=A0AAF0F3X3_9BASI|nr:GTPase-activating protein S13 [Malassezia psittaci]